MGKRISITEERGAGEGLSHAGSRISFWYDPAEHIEEPINKTIGRLKSKTKRVESHAPAQNTVGVADVRVSVKHWLGRMERTPGAH